MKSTIIAITVGLCISFLVIGTFINNNKKKNLNQHDKRGSFLLKTSKEKSEASKAATEAALSQGNELNTSKNDEIGKLLIEQRDKQLGPNVSVFYKQDGGLVITVYK